MLCAAINNS